MDLNRHLLRWWLLDIVGLQNRVMAGRDFLSQIDLVFDFYNFPSIQTFFRPLEQVSLFFVEASGLSLAPSVL